MSHDLETAELWLTIVKLSERDIKVKPGEWRVSEIAGCLRRAQLSRMLGVDPVIKIPEMVVGALLHRYVMPPIVKAYAEARGYKYEIEKEVRDFPLIGHVDALLIRDNKVIPWEFKFTFWEMNRFKDIRMGHVIEQANMYAGMIGADEFRVTVISFYDGEPVIFNKYYDFDPNRFEQRKAEAMSLNEAIATERLMSGPRYTWECSKCRFRVICKYIREQV